MHRARVHILHLSSSDALPMIASAKRDGVRLTVETCPHYLVFDAEPIAAGATQFRCCPPIREPGNRDLLWQGLADGTIDRVVSDHFPCTPELKQLDSGDFGGRLGRHRRVAGCRSPCPRCGPRRTCAASPSPTSPAGCSRPPAALAGLERKGGLVAGRDGDLAVFAPDEAFTVDVARLHHRNPITSYAGRTQDRQSKPVV